MYFFNFFENLHRSLLIFTRLALLPIIIIIGNVCFALYRRRTKGFVHLLKPFIKPLFRFYYNYCLLFTLIYYIIPYITYSYNILKTIICAVCHLTDVYIDTLFFNYIYIYFCIIFYFLFFYFCGLLYELYLCCVNFQTIV